MQHLEPWWNPTYSSPPAPTVSSAFVISFSFSDTSAFTHLQVHTNFLPLCCLTHFCTISTEFPNNNFTLLWNCFLKRLEQFVEIFSLYHKACTPRPTQNWSNKSISPPPLRLFGINFFFFFNRFAGASKPRDPHIPSSRHLMLIDPSDNETSLSFLFSLGICDRQQTQICDISDFIDDALDVVQSEAILKIKHAMEVYRREKSDKFLGDLRCFTTWSYPKKCRQNIFKRELISSQYRQGRQ